MSMGKVSVPMATLTLCRRLLGRPASENGTLCHGDGAHGRGDRLRRAFMLPIRLEPLDGVPPHVEEAGAAGPAQILAARGRQHVAADLPHIDRELADRLAGIEQIEDAVARVALRVAGVEVNGPEGTHPERGLENLSHHG